MPNERKEKVWTLKSRLLALLRTQMEEKGQNKNLEALTGIKATHWRDLFAGKQRPTAEMVEAAARLWPQHAFWLVTGISDAEHGHTAIKRANFPLDFVKQEAPQQFFKKAIELSDACLEAFDADADFGDPEIQFLVLLNGALRSAHLIDLPPEEKERIDLLRGELFELQEARAIEYEIREIQPHETYEETELRLPNRISKLGKTKALSKSSIEDLEALLEDEKKRLEAFNRINERLNKTRNVD